VTKPHEKRGLSPRERREQRKHVREYRRHKRNPCPHSPRQLDADTQLFGEFEKHPGRKRHNRWQAKLWWDEVRVDADGFPVVIRQYKREMEYTANGTDWFLHSRKTIPGKEDADAGTKAHDYAKNIHGRLGYRYRVWAIDSKGCEAEPSDYFVLGTPDDVPPAPSDVKILRHPHGIRVRWRAPVDPEDDELFTQDVVGFVSRLWTNEDFGPIKAFTAVGSTDVFTATAHGFANGDPVMLRNTPGGSSLPTGVLPFKLYYVTNVAANTFKLAREEDAAAINITTDGSGDVLWGLVRVQRHTRLHHADFRIDPEDFDEDTRFYGEVASESDHRSKSAFIPATAPLANDDPDATPIGRRPAWHRHVFTFTILGPVEAKVYRLPDRADDDYLIRRVTAAAGKAGSGAATKFDIKVNGSTFVFDEDSGKTVSIPAGDRDGSSKDVVNPTLERGDHIRVKCESVATTPPEDVTIHVIADRTFDGSTDDSGGGGGE
jgi:hypothetical protein